MVVAFIIVRPWMLMLVSSAVVSPTMNLSPASIVIVSPSPSPKVTAPSAVNAPPLIVVAFITVIPWMLILSLSLVWSPITTVWIAFPIFLISKVELNTSSVISDSMLKVPASKFISRSLTSAEVSSNMRDASVPLIERPTSSVTVDGLSLFPSVIASKSTEPVSRFVTPVLFEIFSEPSVSR